MRGSKRLGVVGVSVALAAIGAACGLSEEDEPWNRLDPRDHRFQRDARAFTGFPVYWLGTSFDGLPLNGVDRSETDVFDRPTLTTPPTRAVPEFGFIYGRCNAPWDPPPGADDPCTLPDVQVSTSALCTNHPALFRGSIGRLRRLGAGALVATRYGQTVVFTGKTFVSILALDRRQGLRAVRALRSINPPHRRIRLTAPDRAEMTRKPRCKGLSHPSG